MLLALESLYSGFEVNVTGVSASAAVGSIRVDVSVVTIGVSASPSIGTVLVHEGIVVTGVTANAQIGQVTISGALSPVQNQGFGEPTRRERRKHVEVQTYVICRAKPRIGRPLFVIGTTFEPDRVSIAATARGVSIDREIKLSDEEILALLEAA